MQTDLHQSMRHLIDRSLAGELSSTEHHSLHEHLHECAACQKYADDSRRAIAGLGGFSFPANADLQAKVFAALAQARAATRSRAASPSAYRAHLHHRASAHHHRLLGRMAHRQSTRCCSSLGARASADRCPCFMGSSLVVLLPLLPAVAPAFCPIGEGERKCPMKTPQFLSVVPKPARIAACAIFCCAVLIGGRWASCAHRLKYRIAGARQARLQRAPACSPARLPPSGFSVSGTSMETLKAVACRPFSGCWSPPDSEFARISPLLRAAPASHCTVSAMRPRHRDRATVLRMVRLRKNLATVHPDAISGAGCPILAQLGWVVSRESDKLPVSSHPAVELESAWKADS